ncbi:unnamed protein product, partial [Meganyctiphanes norvegica]
SHMTEFLAEAAHTSSSMEEFNTRFFNACKNLSYTSPLIDSSQEEPDLNKPIIDMPPSDLPINELETEPANKTPAKTVTEMVETDVEAVLEVEEDENDPIFFTLGKDGKYLSFPNETKLVKHPNSIKILTLDCNGTAVQTNAENANRFFLFSNFLSLSGFLFQTNWLEILNPPSNNSKELHLRYKGKDNDLNRLLSIKPTEKCYKNTKNLYHWLKKVAKVQVCQK